MSGRGAQTRGARAPRVAIVGRQNVGKSTLLNRLFGSRRAIAHEQPGVTRDRIELQVSWRGRSFVVIDTGGYVQRARGLDALVTRQAERAMEKADVILLVVDAIAGIQEEDAFLAKRLRRAGVPVVLVGNKVDSERQEPDAARLFRLGLGEPLPISALHGRGTGELLDRLLALLPEETSEAPRDEETAFAIVGRPNVGKSSLFNRLVGDERAVVSEHPGTTRDAVDSLVADGEGLIRFVDTAGFRRPAQRQGTAYYGFVRAVRAIDRSHVVALMVDGAEGVTTEDRKIAARVAEAGRGLMVVANKWDLVGRGERADRFTAVCERVAVFPKVPVIRTSALTGSGVGKVLPTLRKVHAAWRKRAPTAEVNKVLERAQREHPPPRTSGRILYGTQAASAPPRFVVFATSRIPSQYARFLEGRLREAFAFDGVPIRISFRRRRRR
ncbi:MAG: ribosome biogenesis GTPase Der [Actinomycetota bacterium]